MTTAYHVENQRRDGPDQCWCASVRHRGADGEYQRAEECGDHEPRVDDRPVDLLEGSDEVRSSVARRPGMIVCAKMTKVPAASPIVMVRLSG